MYIVKSGEKEIAFVLSDNADSVQRAMDRLQSRKYNYLHAEPVKENPNVNSGTSKKKWR